MLDDDVVSSVGENEPRNIFEDLTNGLSAKPSSSDKSTIFNMAQEKKNRKKKFRKVVLFISIGLFFLTTVSFSYYFMRKIYYLRQDVRFGTMALNLSIPKPNEKLTRINLSDYLDSISNSFVDVKININTSNIIQNKRQRKTISVSDIIESKPIKKEDPMNILKKAGY